MKGWLPTSMGWIQLPKGTGGRSQGCASLKFCSREGFAQLSQWLSYRSRGCSWDPQQQPNSYGLSLRPGTLCTLWVVFLFLEDPHELCFGCSCFMEKGLSFHPCWDIFAAGGVARLPPGGHWGQGRRSQKMKWRIWKLGDVWKMRENNILLSIFPWCCLNPLGWEGIWMLNSDRFYAPVHWTCAVRC